MVSVTHVSVVIKKLMHVWGIIWQSLAFVLGGAAVAKEATPKSGAKKPIAKEMHEAEKAHDMNNWGMGVIVVVISYCYR